MRDADANYQYRAFGVPGLGFKRGLARRLVIAPYATVMALMVAPEEACKNLKTLRHENAAGNFGFYEALDYTAVARAERPDARDRAFVHGASSGHEFAFARLCFAGPPDAATFRRRIRFSNQRNYFCRSACRAKRPCFIRTDSKPAANANPRAAIEATMRVFTDPELGPPEVHLLSNGRYHVMVTNTGGGYSRWNDTAMTRWREDATRDNWGTFFMCAMWTAANFGRPAYQPTLEARTATKRFSRQGRAEFRSRADHEIDMHTEIAVSPENDVEVRRITFTNHSDEPRRSKSRAMPKLF